MELFQRKTISQEDAQILRDVFGTKTAGDKVIHEGTKFVAHHRIEATSSSPFVLTYKPADPLNRNTLMIVTFPSDVTVPNETLVYSVRVADRWVLGNSLNDRRVSMFVVRLLREHRL